jgi:glycosyltransferase involved in cell wall biosynthesis
MITPRLSVCIHTFNRADLLDHTLESVRELERVDKAFEVVVSDNCSTDATSRSMS